MKLILIRHAQPQADTTAPAAEWRLTQAGRESCRALGTQLKPHNLSRIISSHEPKAIETAQFTARHLDIPSEIAFGLQEQDRANVPYLAAKERFDEMIAELFAKPDECVFGRESATQALTRFRTAITELQSRYPDEPLAIVSHGTVITLFVAAHNEIDGFEFWQGLQMPDVIVLGEENQIIVA